MDSSIISGVVGGVVAVVLCTYISKKVSGSKGNGELRFGVFLAGFAWCSFAFVALAVWAFFNDNDAREKPGEMFSIIGLIIGFGFSSFYCFAEYFKVRGKFDDHGIEFYTPWTGRKIEAWSDLESIVLNEQASWYLLKFKSGKKIRLSKFLSGHGDVLELLRSKGYEC